MTGLAALWWVYVAFAIPVLSGVGVAEPKPAAVVSFAISRPTVTLHEPVYIEFSIRNGTHEPIQFDLGKNREARFEFTITDSGGNTVGPFHLTEAGFGASGHIPLARGETYTQKLILNEWYQFVTPGNYKLGAKLVAVSRPKPGAVLVGSSPSQELNVHIDPRNPARLKKVC